MALSIGWGTGQNIDQGGEEPCIEMTRQGRVVHHRRAKMWICSCKTHYLNVVVTGNCPGTLVGLLTKERSRTPGEEHLKSTSIGPSTTINHCLTSIIHQITAICHLLSIINQQVTVHLTAYHISITNQQVI